jgi:hypothetical protein
MDKERKEETDRIATTSNESITATSQNATTNSSVQIRMSRSVELVDSPEMEMEVGDGSLVRKVRQSLLQSKPNKQQHHKSIDALHQRQLTSKNLELFELQPPPQKNGRQSYFVQAKGMEGGEKGVVSATSSTNLSETTGYRSGRSNSGTIEQQQRDTTPTETSQYSAITGLRNTRMSAMLLSSKSETELLPERERSESTKPVNPKSFKEWYLYMIQQHDRAFSLPKPDKKNVPGTYRLETMFGVKNDPLDPYLRILWMADCYVQIQNAVIWTQAPPEQEVPPPLLTTEPKIQEKKMNVTIDETTPGLKMVTSGTPLELIESLLFPLDQDMSYTHVFLATYKSFITPSDLFHILTKWYHIPEPQDQFQKRTRKQIQHRVIRVFLTWIHHHYLDFHGSSLLESMNVFADSLVHDSFSHHQKLVHAIREQRLSWYTLQYVPVFSGGRVTESGQPYVQEWTVEAFAHNLTMVDHILFRRLKPDMYLHLLWNPGTIDHGAYNVPLKLLLEWCLWFRMVQRNHLGSRIYNHHDRTGR